MTSTVRSRVLGLVTLAVVLGLLGSCAAVGEPAGPAEKVELLKVDSPLREPVWVPGEGALLALGDEEPRVVLVGPEAGTSAGEASEDSAVEASRELEGAGAAALNVREPGRAYVSRPESGRISVLSTKELRELDSLEAGDSPERMTVDAASEILFALSADGSKVTGTDLESSEEIPATDVGGGEETLVESPEKGLYPAFWVAGPEGVAHYAGSPPERKVGLPIAASELVPDAASAQRAYVAGAGTGRVVAVEGDPAGLMEGELEVIAERRLGGEIEQLDADELFVYAATAEELVVMRRHDLQTVESVEYRRRLESDALKEASLSGLAAGEESVYMTLAAEPYVLSVEKS